MENDSSNRFNLENHKKKDLFVAPDHYFEELPHRIQSRINQSKSRPWYEKFAYTPLFRSASIALAMIVIVIGIYLFNQPAEKLLPATTSLNVGNDELEEYLVNSPAAVIHFEELYEDDYSNATYSADEILEQADVEEIEEIVTDL